MMNTIFVGLAFLKAVNSAVSYASNAEQAPQRPFANLCPSNLVLLNGQCQLYPFSELTVQSNTSDTSSGSPQELTADLPWTSWPQCFANENTTSPICVFSDQNFASGRGIFLVTTTAEAYSIASKPAFKDPSTLTHANSLSNPPYEVRDLPGKGRGVIANTTLHRGTLIFALTPLLITDHLSYNLEPSERISLSHTGVSNLPSDSQTHFWNLLDHFKGDPVDDRIHTNAFELSLNGHTHYAVFPELSMLNHDCRPNANYFWDEASLTQYVHATETIYPGQEITITYIDNEQRRAKRMALLKQNWGFECSCSLCSSREMIHQESDSRLKEMEVLTRKLEDWSRGSEASTAMAEALVSLYVQERLTGSLGTAYRIAAETYASYGDRWNAVRCARLSVEYAMLDRGLGDKEVMDMGLMARKPEMTWSWNKRVGRGEGGR